MKNMTEFKILYIDIYKDWLKKVKEVVENNDSITETVDEIYDSEQNFNNSDVTTYMRCFSRDEIEYVISNIYLTLTENHECPQCSNKSLKVFKDCDTYGTDIYHCDWCGWS